MTPSEYVGSADWLNRLKLELAQEGIHLVHRREPGTTGGITLWIDFRVDELERAIEIASEDAAGSGQFEGSAQAERGLKFILIHIHEDIGARMAGRTNGGSLTFPDGRCQVRPVLEQE